MFFKKKKQNLPPTKPPCNHKWKDFDWYQETTFNIKREGDERGYSEVEIYEPYVCIHCKERKNRLLDTFITPFGSAQACDKWAEDYINKSYPNKIKARAYVEDAIADFQLVDRDYLRAAELVYRWEKQDN